MVSELTCWPIAYQRDAVSQESRNIGVLVWGEGSAEIAMMGCDPSGNIEPAYFCKAFNYGEGAGWIYREWVRWFRSLAAEVTTNEEIEAEFGHLKCSGSHFGVGNPIQVAASAHEKISDVADSMFQQLVVVPKLTQRLPSFTDQVEDLVQSSEIEYRAPFHRNVELEIQCPDQTKFVQLTYFLESSDPLGIKLLRFKGKDPAEVAIQVSDIRYTFNILIENGILNPTRCVVLHDTPKTGLEEQLHRLAGSVVLLALEHPESSRQLKNMVLIER